MWMFTPVGWVWVLPPNLHVTQPPPGWLLLPQSACWTMPVPIPIPEPVREPEPLSEFSNLIMLAMVACGEK